MGAPEAFEVVPVHLSRGCPAFGAAQDDHGPARPKRSAGAARLFLDFADLQDAMLQGRRHRLMHAGRIAALDEIRGVPVTGEQRRQLVVADARQDGRIVDLVAVEMQDRQHRPIGDRVEELVAVPAGRQRSGLGLPVAHHHEGDQVRVVVDRPIGVRKAVAEFAALVDAAGRFRSGVAADAARKGELLEQALHPRQIFALVRIDLGIRAFEIRLGQDRRRPVPGAADIDRVQVVLLDQPVEVDVGEALAGIRPPMTEQPRLDVLQAQGLSQQGIGLQIQHPHAQIEAGPPIRVDLVQLVGTEWFPLDR